MPSRAYSQSVLTQTARALAVFATVCLLAESPPSHVATSDYFGGGVGTHFVDPADAGRWLTWAETDVADSPRLRAVGVKTLLYTDPNRTLSRQPEGRVDESAFAHDCAGGRVEAYRAGQYLMDPHSPALLAAWKGHAQRYARAGQFDAVFEDDADDVAYLRGMPCRYAPSDWLQATIAMQQALGYPIVYNGLSNFSGQSVSPAIGLNATAIGGMMEQCYARSPALPKTTGAHWLVTEDTELRMAAEGKLFFCYGNDTTPAVSALDGRLYVYASFLLGYDPSSSVLWEYYQGPSRFHVMPETQLVPLQPRTTPRSVADLRTASGIYQRAYGACYLAGSPQGPCVVAVNPDAQAHPLNLTGYTRTLQISGGGVLDGGTARVAAPGPPGTLGALSAVVAFK
jgi:hypothetical protein